MLFATLITCKRWDTPVQLRALHKAESEAAARFDAQREGRIAFPNDGRHTSLAVSARVVGPQETFQAALQEDRTPSGTFKQIVAQYDKGAK